MNPGKVLLLFCIAVLMNSVGYTQGTAFNTTGAAADASAIVDMSSITQGYLSPRMTSAQRSAIANPATGLTVYQTDGVAGYYYNSGTSGSPEWKKLPGISGTGASNGQTLKWDGTNWTPATAGRTYDSGIQVFDISGSATSFTFTVTDASVRYILLDAKTRALSSGVSCTINLLSAASYPAGSMFYFQFENLTTSFPTWYFQSASSTYTAFNVNNVSVSSTPYSLSATQGIRLITDGVSRWYKLNN